MGLKRPNFTIGLIACVCEFAREARKRLWTLTLQGCAHRGAGALVNEDVMPPKPLQTQVEIEGGADVTDGLTVQAHANGPIEDVCIRGRGTRRTPETNPQAIGLVLTSIVPPWPNEEIETEGDPPARPYIYIYMCVYIYLYMYIYIFKHIYICMHTYRHIDIDLYRSL